MTASLCVGFKFHAAYRRLARVRCEAAQGGLLVHGLEGRLKKEATRCGPRAKLIKTSGGRLALGSCPLPLLFLLLSWSLLFLYWQPFFFTGCIQAPLWVHGGCRAKLEPKPTAASMKSPNPRFSLPLPQKSLRSFSPPRVSFSLSYFKALPLSLSPVRKGFRFSLFAFRFSLFVLFSFFLSLSQ